MKNILIRIFILTLLLLPAGAAFAGPPSFFMQGQLIRSDGTAVEAASVNFTVQLLSTADECLLLEETFTLNMSGSAGIFNLSVGNGTNTGAGGVANVDQAINNSLGNLTGLTCSSGTAYDPNPGDTRKIRITFDEGSGAVTLPQDHVLQSVPYAMYAGTLGGMTSDEFIQVNTSGAGVSQANIETVFDGGANFTELLALLAGTSSQYAQIGASGAGSLPTFDNTTPPVAPVAGDIWYNSDTTTIQYFDGTTTQNIGSGTVSNVATGSGLTGGPITSTGTISVATGGITNTHLASGIDASKITTGTLPAGVVPSGTDSSKLPLAGGTMTGDIDFNGNHLLQTGYITMNPANPLHLGVFTNAEQTTLIGTFTVPADHAGKTWFNTDDSSLKYWDGAQVVDLQSQASDKLPLAGGTMSGTINMDDNAITNILNLSLNGTPGTDNLDFNSQNVLNTGHITVSPQYTINLGAFTSAQEIAYEGTLGAGDVGSVWYNTDTDQIKLWTNATNALVVASLGNEAGFAMAADSVPNCTSTQKLQMSVGPTYAWSCVAESGDIDSVVTSGTSGLSGGVASGTVTLQVEVDGTTLEINGSNDLQVRDGGITSSKVALNTLVADDIAADAITASELADDAVDTAAILDDAVTSAKIDNGTIVTADIAIGAINNSRILDGTIIKDDLANNSVDTSKIATNTILANDIATGAVETDEILDGTISSDDLANSSVTDAKINTMSVGKLINGASQYFTYQPNNTACADGEVLKWDNTNARWECGVDSSADNLGNHTATTNLNLATNTLLGGTAASDDLTLDSTSDATKGDIILNPTGGNVGIGTASPSWKLSVEDTNSWLMSLRRDIISTTAGGGIVFESKNTNSDYRASGQVLGILTNTTPGAEEGALSFGTRQSGAVSEKMRINSDGNVGIGTVTPSTNLHIREDGGTAQMRLEANTDGGFPYVSGVRSRGTTAAPTALTANNVMLAIDGFGYDGTGNANQVGISFRSSEIWNATDKGSRITFDVTQNGTTTKAEVMRIENDGRVGIGDTTPDAKLDVEGRIISGPNGTAAGDAGSIVLSELAANGSNYIGFRSPDSVTANTIFELPDGDGSSGQVLTTDGSGVLTWTTSSGGDITGVTTAADSGLTGGAASGDASLSLDVTGTTDLSASPDTADSFLVYDSSAGALREVTIIELMGSIDHGSLPGLTDDDHTQYALLAGRSGGQTLIGGTDASDNLTIDSTSNATKGDIILNSTGGNVGIGITNPTTTLDINADRGATAGIQIRDADDSGNWRLRFRNSSPSGHGLIEMRDVSENKSVEIRAAGSTYFNGGNVGVGTDSPDATFHVLGGDMRLGGAPDSERAFTLYRNTSEVGKLTTGNGGFTIAARNNNDILFQDDTATRMVLEDGGNVGIGTTAPNYQLDVSGVGGGGSLLQLHRDSDLSGSQLSNNIDFAFDDSATEVNRVRIQAIGHNTTLTDDGGELSLQVANPTGTLVEGLRIDSDGNVGLGDSTPDSKLDVEGRLTSGPSGTAAGNGGSIVLKELVANGTNSIGFRAPDAVTADVVFELPDGDGSSGQVLTTDGSGVLTWSTSSGGDITGVTTAADSGLTGGSASGDASLSLDVAGTTDLSASPDAADSFLVYDSSAGALREVTITELMGSIDHGSLSGLTDDDHTQYALLAGRSGGQTLIGGIDASDDLIIDSTSNATKGDILLNPTGGNVGVGSAIPSYKLSVVDITSSSTVPKLWVGRTNVAEGFGVAIDDGGTVLRSVQDETAAEVHSLRNDLQSSASGNHYQAWSFNNTEVMRVSSTGNLGIGTTNPEAQLEVSGVESPTIILDDDQGTSQRWSIGESNGALVFKEETDSSAGDDVVFDITGSVAVGNITPSSKLDIDGDLNLREMTAPSVSAADQGRIYFDATDNKFKVSENGGGYVDLFPTSGVGSGDFLADGTVAMTGNLQLNNQWLSNDGDSEGIRIDNDGNVGVGIASPNNKLVVADNLSNQARIGFVQTSAVRTNFIGLGDADEIIIAADENDEGTASNIQFRVDGSEAVRIDAGGDVFIGTGTLTNASGSEDLSVTGNLEVDGTIYGTLDSSVGITHSLDAAYDDGSSVTVDSTDVIYNLSSTQDFHIQDNGAALFTVLDNGRVGIGVDSSLTHKLHVVSSISALANFERTSGEFSIVDITAGTDTGNSILRFSDQSGDAGQIDFEHNNNSLNFEVNSNVGLTINSSGYTGVGTTNPQTQLHVLASGTPGTPSIDGTTVSVFQRSAAAGNRSRVSVVSGNTGEAQLTFGDTDNALISAITYDNNTNALEIAGNGSLSLPDILISSTSNVGIGNITPNARLHVGGEIRSQPSSGSAGDGGTIQLEELAANGTNYVGFRAPDSIGSDTVWELPASDGTSGQVLQTNGSGVLSWITPGGGGASNLDDLGDVTTNYANDNMLLGSGTGAAVSTGTDNIAVGDDAFTTTSTGSNNSAFGSQALNGGPAAGSNNTAMGYQSLFNINGSSNTAVGSGALFNNSGGHGDHNAALGRNAGFSTAAGAFTASVLVGSSAGEGGSGTNVVSIGRYAGYGSTGSQNITIGEYAGPALSGTENVILGRRAYFTNSGTSTASYNVALGGEVAGDLPIKTGSNNVSLGYRAHYTMTSGANNIALGFQAADNITSGSNNITIGHNINVASATGSNQLNIGNAITGDLSTGDIEIDNEVRWNDSDDSNYVGFVSPATVSSNVIWTLPDADGTSGQVLQTNGSGVLSWADAGGGGGAGFTDGGNTATGNMTLGTDNSFDLDIITNNTSRAKFDSNGKIRIGTGAIPSDTSIYFNATAQNSFLGSAFEFGGTLNSTTNSQYFINVQPTIAPSGTSTRSYSGLVVRPNFSTSNTVTSADYAAIDISQDTSGATAMDEMYGLRVYQRMLNTSSVDNAYSIYVEDPFTNSGTSSIGNDFYGIYIEGTNNVATNDTYALYTQGTAPSRFGGHIGIGDNTPDAYLEIANEITPAAPYIMMSSDDFQDGDVFIVENDGDVGIGDKTPSYKLDVNGNLQVQGSSTTCVLGDGAGATNCTSDSRLKEQVEPIASALDKILDLRGVEFVWNHKSQSPGVKAIGVIAQEVERHFPTTVIKNRDSGYKMVDYAALVAPLIQATKEQQDIIDANKAYCEVNYQELRDRMNKLQNKSEENSRDIASVQSENEKLKKQNQELKRQLEDLSKKHTDLEGDLNKIKTLLNIK